MSSSSLLRQLVYLAVSLVVIAVTFCTSLAVEKSRPGIDLSMGGIRTLYGLTIATSHYQYGSPLYGFYEPVYKIFHTDKIMGWNEVEGLLAKAASLDPKSLAKDDLHIGFREMGLDDKGTVWWYSAAFGLFGLHLSSLYSFYFLLMAIGLVTYWFAFRKDEPALVLMALYPLVHLLLAAFVLDSNPDVLGSLLGARPFAMLGTLPALHLTLLIIRQRQFSPWLALGAFLQIAYLLLVISVRSSAQVQLLFVLLAGVCYVLWQLYRKQRPRLSFACAWVPLILFACMLTASALYATAIPSDVRERTTKGHLFWYSGLAGFDLNRTLYDDLDRFAVLHKIPHRFNGIYDANGNKLPSPGLDAVVANAVIGYAEKELHTEIGDFLFGDPAAQDYVNFERYARKLFFYELRERPVEMLHLYLIDKSWNYYLVMQSVLHTISLWDALAVAFLLGLFAGGVWLSSFTSFAPLLLGGAVFCSLPAFWFTPSTISMYDYAPFIYLCILATGTTLGAYASRAFARFRLAPLLPALGLVMLPVLIVAILFATRYTGERSKILVVSATYGGNAGAKTGNVTEKLRKACNGKPRCNYLIDVGVLGDPAGGVGKDFVLEYQCSYELKPIRITVAPEAHNHKIRLRCDKGK